MEAEAFDTAWKHSSILKDDQFQYLYLFLKDAGLSNYADEPQEYREIEKTLQAQATAAITSKINLQNSCIYDMIPKHQLLKWFSMRESALYRISREVPKPSDYEILHKAHVVVSEIENQDVNYKGKKGRILYNIFGSATGRLTTKRGSVPILTLKKEDRCHLVPTNDAYVEFDLNAAEIRTLLALQGLEQPSEDIHSWISRKIFNGKMKREEVKTKVFAWLYNSSATESRLDKFFSRQIFRDFYSHEDQVLETPFGRKLEVEERKAQNYLLQSTTSDQVLENAYNIQKLFETKRSKIAFMLHDSIILDMAKEDAIMLKEVKKMFEKTKWGNFISTCKIGADFGSLKDLKI